MNFTDLFNSLTREEYNKLYEKAEMVQSLGLFPGATLEQIMMMLYGVK